MPRRTKRFWKGIERAAWLMLWILALCTPVLYYLVGYRGILMSVVGAPLPVLITSLYSAWQYHRNRRPINIGRIATLVTVFDLLFFAVYWLHHLGFTAAFILWGSAGVVLGSYWGYRWRSSERPWFILAAIVWAGFQSWRGFKNSGVLGAINGPALIGGIFVGLLLAYLVAQLWHYLRSLWKDLITYGWQYATFIIGYLIIIYVFAGLFAMEWRTHPGSLGPAFKQDSESFGHFLYYSLSTASTLGYTEGGPVSRWAKVLISMEVLTGIFWITVVFGHLSDSVKRGRRHRKRTNNN
jgi:hypothetical protein